MTNTTKLFDLAELAEAAYANFTNFNTSTPPSDIKIKLVASSFTEVQATEFAKHWKVVHHQADTVGGFSGTLFQRIENDPISGYQAGQLVYAVRGTAGPSDLTTDTGDISIDGLALDQIVCQTASNTFH